jgi:multidrug efflux pump subunit AcrA (membrane-fusion protein)
MKHRVKKSEKMIRNISKSILLKETGSPKILNRILLFISLITIIFLVWAGLIRLEEKVTAEGEIFTIEDKIIIQHPQGGTVDQLFVKEGQIVEKNQTILKFDESEVKSRISEINVKINSISTQIKSLKEELKVKKELLDEGLLSSTVYYNLERKYNTLTGDLSENREIRQRLIMTLKNLELTSPIEGRIFNMKTLAKGSVIKSGEKIMEVIPGKQEFVAYIKVKPENIGTVNTGSTVNLKFSAYDYNKFGTVSGEIQDISPATLLDENKSPYYRASVYISKNYLGSDSSKNRILPGMLLTAEIKIGTKSLLEYLFLPVKAKMDEAFTEQ